MSRISSGKTFLFDMMGAIVLKRRVTFQLGWRCKNQNWISPPAATMFTSMHDPQQRGLRGEICNHSSQRAGWIVAGRCSALSAFKIFVVLSLLSRDTCHLCEGQKTGTLMTCTSHRQMCNVHSSGIYGKLAAAISPRLRDMGAGHMISGRSGYRIHKVPPILSPSPSSSLCCTATCATNMVELAASVMLNIVKRVAGLSSEWKHNRAGQEVKWDFLLGPPPAPAHPVEN